MRRCRRCGPAGVALSPVSETGDDSQELGRAERAGSISHEALNGALADPGQHWGAFVLVIEILWLAGIREAANGEFWSGGAA